MRAGQHARQRARTLVALRARRHEVHAAPASGSVTDAVRKPLVLDEDAAHRVGQRASDGEGVPFDNHVQIVTADDRSSTASRTSPPTTKARAAVLGGQAPGRGQQIAAGGLEPALEAALEKERDGRRGPSYDAERRARSPTTTAGARPARCRLTRTSDSRGASAGSRRASSPSGRVPIPSAVGAHEIVAQHPAASRRRRAPRRAGVAPAAAPSVALSVAGAATSAPSIRSAAVGMAWG